MPVNKIFSVEEGVIVSPLSAFKDLITNYKPGTVERHSSTPGLPKGDTKIVFFEIEELLKLLTKNGVFHTTDDKNYELLDKSKFLALFLGRHGKDPIEPDKNGTARSGPKRPELANQITIIVGTSDVPNPDYSQGFFDPSGMDYGQLSPPN